MRVRPALLSFFAASLLVTPVRAADNGQQLRDRLKDAALHSALDGKGMPPWHWKLEITLFDNDGKNPNSGTLEMWSQSGSLRTTLTLGADQVTALRVGDVLYRDGGSEKALLSAAYLQQQLLHPIPDEVFQPNVSVSLKSVDAGSLKLDCISPAWVQSSAFSFCLVGNTAKLAATYVNGGINFFRAQIGTFQTQSYPMRLQVMSGKIKLAEAKTVTLAPEPIDPALLEVTPEMTPYNGPVDYKLVDLHVQALSQSPPHYPRMPNGQHLSGSVVFDAVIGKDGHVASLRVANKADLLLSGAATEAVTHWLYRPFQINGVPFEVKTQIAVAFNFGAP